MMTITHDMRSADEDTRFNIRTGVELVLQCMAGDAARLRDKLFDPEHRQTLTENTMVIEEVRDQMDGLLKALKRGKT